MKNSLIYIYLLLTLNFCYCQNLEITYVKAYKNFKDFTDREPKILKNLEYKLKIRKNKACFEIVPSMSTDITNERIVSRGGGKGKYYKDIKTKEKFHQKTSPFNGKLYLVKFPFNEYNWKLLNEKKVISGYNCFKAIANYSYISNITKKEVQIIITAWYTPEINLPFGPAGRDGLPGLVLETFSSSFYFIAKKIIFDSKNIIKKPKKGIKVTNIEFDLISTKEFDTRSKIN